MQPPCRVYCPIRLCVHYYYTSYPHSTNLPPKGIDLNDCFLLLHKGEYNIAVHVDRILSVIDASAKNEKDHLPEEGQSEDEEHEGIRDAVIHQGKLLARCRTESLLTKDDIAFLKRIQMDKNTG